MYKNMTKMTLSICLWALVSCITLPLSIVFIGVSFSDIQGKDAILMRIIFIILAAAFTSVFVLFWRKFLSLMRVHNLNNLFEADEDGFVPIADLSKAMNMPEVKLRKLTEMLIRKGYLINLNYDASSRAFLLSDKITAKKPLLAGKPENKPFVGVHCPGCAASLKIRVNTRGTCPYCGREIIVK